MGRGLGIGLHTCTPYPYSYFLGKNVILVFKITNNEGEQFTCFFERRELPVMAATYLQKKLYVKFIFILLMCSD